MANDVKVVSFTKGYGGIYTQGSQVWAESDVLIYSMNIPY